MTWVDGLAYIEEILGIEWGLLLRVMFKGEPQVGESCKFKSVGLVDNGASLSASNKGAVYINGHGKPGVYWGKK